jgi:hypothetical protein
MMIKGKEGYQVVAGLARLPFSGKAGEQPRDTYARQERRRRATIQAGLDG